MILSGVGSLTVSNEKEYLRVAEQAIRLDPLEMQASFLSSIALSLAKIADLMEAEHLDFHAYDDSTAPQ